jgi:enoyl reductase-like protein
MEELKAKYAQQVALYESYIQEGAEIQKISALNIEIGKTLEEMIGILTNMKQDNGGLIQEQRNQLIEKLQRIQQDYNGLIQNTDKLETLRRIRESEQTVSTKTLQLYLIFFFVILLVILLLMLFFQKKPIAAPIPRSPAIAASFT